MHRLLHLSRVRIRRGIAWLWSQEGTPGQRARGLAAGVFCGCYPFFGLQMVLSVGLAKLMRGNQLLAAAGTLVSNPFTYLPLYWFNYLVGCRLMGPSVDPLGGEPRRRPPGGSAHLQLRHRLLPRRHPGERRRCDGRTPSFRGDRVTDRVHLRV